MAWAGGSTYSPTMARSFSAKRGSLESLKARTRCGCRPCARQIRCTELALMPTAAAMAAAVQCVVSPGGSPVVVSVDHPGRHLGAQRRDARRPGLVPQQPVDPRGHEPLLPAPDRDLARARPAA